MSVPPTPRSRMSYFSKKQLEDKDFRPIPFRDTLEMVTNFVITTVEFLNRFAGDCEFKLQQVASSLQKMEGAMSLLEAKLNSTIKDQPVSSQPSNTPSNTQPTVQQGSSNVPPPPPQNSQTSNLPQQQDVSVPPLNLSEVDPVVGQPTPKSNIPITRDDPRLAAYFKLVRIRVPIQQVKAKMQLEGYDPSLLE
jgi:WASH complex subunit CCDC53